MFEQTQAHTVCPLLKNDHFSIGALQLLPTNLRVLSFSEPFTHKHFNESSQCNLCSALSRLSRLQSLSIGNFLTDVALNVLSAALLPYFRNFDFRGTYCDWPLHCCDSYQKQHTKHVLLESKSENTFLGSGFQIAHMVLTPSALVSKLSVVLRSLQHQCVLHVLQRPVPCD